MINWKIDSKTMQWLQSCREQRKKDFKRYVLIPLRKTTTSQKKQYKCVKYKWLTEDNVQLVVNTIGESEALKMMRTSKKLREYTHV